MGLTGPAEALVGPGAWPEAYRARAIALDLAGATKDDVNAGLDSLAAMDGRVAPAHQWDYFAAIVAARVGTRTLAKREE